MISRFLPSRKGAIREDAKVVCDLDDMVTQPYAFVFQGKTYVIKPVTLEDFAVCVNLLGEIDSLSKKNQVDRKEVVRAYTRFFSSVCPQITESVVLDLNAVQLAALGQLVVDILTGRVEKKNTVMVTVPDSPRLN